MNLPYDNAHAAAQRLQRSYFPGFKLLPFSRFDAIRSEIWWILPQYANPAFHLGKIEASLDDSNPGTLFVGFSVEKGYGQNASGKESEVMKPHWFWREFVRDLIASLGERVEQANRATGGGVEVRVRSAMPKSNQSHASVTLDTQDGQLMESEYSPGDGLLNGLAASDSFDTFAARLRALDAAPSQWHWMNVLVGTVFTLDPAGDDDTFRCAEMLEPFRSWMRSGNRPE